MKNVWEIIKIVGRTLTEVLFTDGYFYLLISLIAWLTEQYAFAFYMVLFCIAETNKRK